MIASNFNPRHFDGIFGSQFVFWVEFWKWVILINNYLLPSSLVERIRTTFPDGVIG
jgi:hypothetical protein